MPTLLSSFVLSSSLSFPNSVLTSSLESTCPQFFHLNFVSTTFLSYHFYPLFSAVYYFSCSFFKRIPLLLKLFLAFAFHPSIPLPAFVRARLPPQPSLDSPYLCLSPYLHKFKFLASRYLAVFTGQATRKLLFSLPGVRRS